MTYTVSTPTDFSTTALDGAVRELLSALDEESKAVTSENKWKGFRDRWSVPPNSIRSRVSDLWLKPAPEDSKRDVARRVNQVVGRIETAIIDAYDRARDYEILEKKWPEHRARTDLAKKLIEESESAAAKNPGLSVLTSDEALTRADEQLGRCC